MKVIIGYDIFDEKRLRKVAKILQDYGLRIQYSFFEVDISEKDLISLRYKLKKVIKENEDRIIIIKLCEKCYKRIEKLGQQVLYDFTQDDFIV